MRWVTAGFAGSLLVVALTGCGGASTPDAASTGTAPATGDPAYVVARVRTGTAPCGILVAAGKVWVSNYGDGTLVTIDPATHAVSAPVKVGVSPCGLAYGAGSVWVENYGDNTLTRVDASTGSVQSTVKVGGAPYDVTFADGAAWVTDYTDGTVSRIDAATGSRTVVKVGDTPVGIAHTPGAVWVPLPSSGRLARIDTATLAVTAVPLTPGIGWTAYDEHSVWVANGTTGTVTRDDAASGTVAATIKVGPKPLDGDVVDGVVWVPDKGGDLYPIDASTNAVGRPISSGTGNPFVVAGGDHLLWAVDFAGTDVVAIDPLTARG